MTDPSSSEARWHDAQLALTLLAIAPSLLGGILIRSSASPEREAVLADLDALIPSSEPRVRIPLGITRDRLLGGLSLAATLNEGRLVFERGALERAHGGFVLVPSAERIDAAVTTELCSAIDRGMLTIEQEGRTATPECRVAVIALDEGLDGEHAPTKLEDRLALHIDLHDLRSDERETSSIDSSSILTARAALSATHIEPSMVSVLCEAALALGALSLRAPVYAAAVARAHAAWQGRSIVDETDVKVAARLVLGPRATRLPVSAEDAEEAPAQPEPPKPERAEANERAHEDERDNNTSHDGESITDIVLEAAQSAMPKGLLDALTRGAPPRSTTRSQGHSGSFRVSPERGRRIGTRASTPRGSERINLLETLRAAAPWQRLRKSERGAHAPPNRLEIRSSDFRVNRYLERTETSVIFSVDASGSSAMQRLAEAKGAVELVLSDCYARRDHVALLSFRGAEATLLLPPTRSLTRARRCLAELAGGGGTPLAAGLDAALEVALDARKRGRLPVIVVMTDGRANVGKPDSSGDAHTDALASARAIRIAGARALFLDTSPRPRAEARRIADEMSAHYVPLPYVDAAGVSTHVRTLVRSKS